MQNKTGVHLAASVNGGVIYTSADSGGTWVARQVNSTQWGGLTSSADGRRLAAADEQGSGGMSNGGLIYTSSDYGAHWNAQPSGENDWWGLSGSSDGLSLVTSSNGGVLQVVHSQVTTLFGSQYDTATLQYTGGGVFALASQQGDISAP